MRSLLSLIYIFWLSLKETCFEAKKKDERNYYYLTIEGLVFNHGYSKKVLQKFICRNVIEAEQHFNFYAKQAQLTGKPLLVYLKAETFDKKHKKTLRFLATN